MFAAACKLLWDYGLTKVAMISVATFIGISRTHLSVHASDFPAATCANLLASGGYRTILRQAQELGVVPLSDQLVGLDDLYVKLKDAEWSNPDPDSLRGTLLAHRHKHFAIETMSDGELKIFWSNSVHALYSRVAELWYVQEVRTQVGPVMRKEIEETLSQMLSRRFTPWGLADRDLTPEFARHEFRLRNWMPWPWLKIASFLGEWFEHVDQLAKSIDSNQGDPSGRLFDVTRTGRSATPFDSREFSAFWDQRAGAYGLGFDMYNRVYLSLSGWRRTAVCCLSEPGCVICPHNRRWRRE